MKHAPKNASGMLYFKIIITLIEFRSREHSASRPAAPLTTGREAQHAVCVWEGGPGPLIGFLCTFREFLNVSVSIFTCMK